MLNGNAVILLHIAPKEHFLQDQDLSILQSCTKCHLKETAQRFACQKLVNLNTNTKEKKIELSKSTFFVIILLLLSIFGGKMLIQIEKEKKI